MIHTIIEFIMKNNLIKNLKAHTDKIYYKIITFFQR